MESARRDMHNKDYKWAIVKAYYSMLHAAKAYVRSKGLIITNHKCTYLYLERCARNGEFETRYAIGYKGALEFRWDADYGLKYDENTANEVINVASDFNEKMKNLIGIKIGP
ncbi:HEPN domain-containing protein [Methanocella conradii]|nr:HEPN domain-containing protein [Methanocella conradii]MDI6896742.1 HEPN domain-containing protein [Methanocella conradii]